MRECCLRRKWWINQKWARTRHFTTSEESFLEMPLRFQTHSHHTGRQICSQSEMPGAQSFAKKVERRHRAWSEAYTREELTELLAMRYDLDSSVDKFIVRVKEIFQNRPFLQKEKNPGLRIPALVVYAWIIFWSDCSFTWASLLAWMLAVNIEKKWTKKRTLVCCLLLLLLNQSLNDWVRLRLTWG